MDVALPCPSLGKVSGIEFWASTWTKEPDGKTSTTASKWPSPSPLTLSGADCGSEFQDTGATE
ncbi:hypothetical protein CH63R_12590 [Colletotrichum higginsianum IMI 349063]|uniref:Uncharacterized protein n=1 Tax=Colletotrichum higginsianum (strain IMI 349063) TaxID=759273 RepID=A0A1B7XUN6_COLHI|nr:hypothetical protein CH63R_12590 [Colletotrichum higginsianum IMI 349063]OBR03463.1 hypothetical protein CH63R_12590 [Colletotrichum higginsianum IMI 349063]GJD02194.1 hypothetical protein ColKHC_11019 [Colletotrichum higginsianum]